MGTVRDLTGQVFGKMTVLEYVGILKRHSVWKCRCECGNIKRVLGSNLVSGVTASCGCQSAITKRRRSPTKKRFSRLKFLATETDI